MTILALVAVISPAGSTPLPTFEELKWTERGAEYTVLSTAPTVCTSSSKEPDFWAGAGEVIFRAPTLLGGQAAKAGLNCASCHRNGRDNPHFQMGGVSNSPGTSDVTNSFFGAMRGNGKFDPVRIPDLTAPGKISRDEQSAALEAFIRNLIVEEFDGNEPSDAVLKAIASYIRGIEDCGEDYPSTSLVRLTDTLLVIEQAVMGSKKWMGINANRQETNLLIMAIRHQLGIISERYSGTHLSMQRESLLAESRALQKIGNMESIDGMGPALELWYEKFSRSTVQDLLKMQNKSLYDPKRLAAAFPAKAKR